MIPAAVLALLTEVFRLFNNLWESTPKAQRVAFIARWNVFWAPVGDAIARVFGIKLPPMPWVDLEIEEDKVA